MVMSPCFKLGMLNIEYMEVQLVTGQQYKDKGPSEEVLKGNIYVYMCQQITSSLVSLCSSLMSI